MDQNKRNAVNSLLAARFGKAIFHSSDPDLALTRVPAKHLRTQSSPFLPIDLNLPKGKIHRRRASPQTSRPSKPQPLDYPPEGTPRTSSTPVTCRVTTSKLSHDLRISCIKARFSLQKERVQVQRQARSIHRRLHTCSLAVKHALHIDIQGFLPKALIMHRAKLRTQRAALSPAARNGNLDMGDRKEVVREYRKALLNKALTRGIGKEMRYLYTCGSCSALGT